MGGGVMSGISPRDRNFNHLLRKRWEKGFFTCVGLDIDAKKIPQHLLLHNSRGINLHKSTLAFVKGIVEATCDQVCAFKPNFAFNEADGALGLVTLRSIVKLIHTIAPDIPVIVDRKGGDIGNTNLGTAKGVFGYLNADATTVNPYFGGEALEPFLRFEQKGIFVLCRTSNPGAGEFQNLIVEEYGAPVYAVVAQNFSRTWNTNGNCGLVVGATAPVEIGHVRQRAPGLPLLIPGVGTQEGDLAASVAAGQTSDGDGIIINASRSIIYASSETNYDEAARAEVLKMNNTINAHRIQS